MKKILTTSLIAASLAAFATSANGAALIYEPFAQATGTLNGATASTTGLTGTWTSNSTGVIQAESLSYGNLGHSGNQATIDQGTSGNQSANVSTSSALADANLLQSGATLWFSTMFSSSAGNSSNEHSGFGLGSGNFGTTYNGVTQDGDGVGFYKQGTSIKAAFWLDGGRQETISGSAQTITFGASEFLVGKITWSDGTGANEHSITLYNPSTSDLGTLGTGFTTTISAATFDQTAMSTIGWGDKDSGGTQTYDEIRFGADYALVPEPSAALLGALGGLALLRRRR
jgi:hypothetical protein